MLNANAIGFDPNLGDIRGQSDPRMFQKDYLQQLAMGQPPEQQQQQQGGGQQQQGGGMMQSVMKLAPLLMMALA